MFLDIILLVLLLALCVIDFFDLIYVEQGRRAKHFFGHRNKTEVQCGFAFNLIVTIFFILYVIELIN